MALTAVAKYSGKFAHYRTLIRGHDNTGTATRVGTLTSKPKRREQVRMLGEGGIDPFSNKNSKRMESKN